MEGTEIVISVNYVSLIIGWIILLGSVALGWFLNERSTLSREKKKEQKQIQATRLLIKTEIAQNLNLVDEYTKSLELDQVGKQTGKSKEALASDKLTRVNTTSKLVA